MIAEAFEDEGSIDDEDNRDELGGWVGTVGSDVADVRDD